jgi:hypothetical protein
MPQKTLKQQRMDELYEDATLNMINVLYSDYSEVLKIQKKLEWDLMEVRKSKLSQYET